MPLALIAIAVATLATPAPRAADTAAVAGRCLRCHGLANFAVREAATTPPRNLSVSAAGFAQSVHGKLACEECHSEITAYPHQFAGARRAQVSCAQECHARDASGGVYTHAAQIADFDVSAHGRGGRGPVAADRPTCLTCHGSGNPHAIARAKGQTARARMAVCAECHADRARMTRNEVDADAVVSYRRSFHYKAIVFGDAGRHAAVCQDCHTTHRVLSASDPTSSVAAAALPATCGQQACHAGARKAFSLSGANHLDLRVKREPILRAEEALFFGLTAGTLALLAIGIVLDLQRRFAWVGFVVGAAAQLRRSTVSWIQPPIAYGRRAARVARWLLVE